MKQEIDRSISTLEIEETIAPQIGWFRYFEAALLSGTASVIFGSFICGTVVIANSVEKFEPINLIIILLCIIYSAVVIFPVSLFIAYPLIILLRQTPGWIKLSISTIAGTLLSTILLFSAPWLYGVIVQMTAVVQMAVIGAVYGLIFGLSAAWLDPYWCAPRPVRAR